MVPYLIDGKKLIDCKKDINRKPKCQMIISLHSTSGKVVAVFNAPPKCVTSVL